MNNDFISLEIESTGENVKILQEKLRILGYYSAVTTGSFGKSTELAVKAFQKDNNLEETGIVDIKTWDLLFDKTSPENIENLYRVTLPTLKIGDSGEYVKQLQTTLKQILYYEGNITGIFDVNTQNAVKQFQMYNNLTTTGIVNEKTWSALSYLYAPLAICENGGNVEEGNYYTVVSGDTLFSIARKFNTTVSELKRLNNLTGNTLTIGQKLLISEKETKPPSEEYDTYIVKSGDTLYSIARKYNITTEQLKNINNLSSNTLSINQSLKVPKQETTIPPITEIPSIYVVQPGDTLYSISRRFGISVNELIALNNLSSTVLSVGQNLIINETPSYLEYIIKRGDTLYSIASKYNVTVDSIKRLNGLTSNNLSIGQSLKIPR